MPNCDCIFSVLEHRKRQPKSAIPNVPNTTNQMMANSMIKVNLFTGKMILKTNEPTGKYQHVASLFGRNVGFLFLKTQHPLDVPLDATQRRTTPKTHAYTHTQHRSQPDSHSHHAHPTASFTASLTASSPASCFQNDIVSQSPSQRKLN